jgi:hypothetical protein
LNSAERGGNLGVSGIPEQINRTLRKNEIYCEEKTTLEPYSGAFLKLKKHNTKA